MVSAAEVPVMVWSAEPGPSSTKVVPLVVVRLTPVTLAKLITRPPVDENAGMLMLAPADGVPALPVRMMPATLADTR